MDLSIRREGERLYIGSDPEAPLAELDFALDGPKLMTLLHTGVSEALRGQGVARRLVEAAVALARAEGRRIVPACSYARKVLEGDPQYADVLAEDG